MNILTIRQRIVAALTIATLVFLGSIALAETPAPSDPATASQPTREEIIKLLDAVRTHQQVVRIYAAMKAGMKTGATVGMKQELNRDLQPEETKFVEGLVEDTFADLPVDTLINAMVPVYQKYLTRSDVKSVTDFFLSPAGQSYLDKSPAIAEEAQQVAAEIMKPLIPQMSERVNNRVQEFVKTRNGANEVNKDSVKK